MVEGIAGQARNDERVTKAYRRQNSSGLSGLGSEEVKDIFILGIETSCDETAAAVVKNGRFPLSNIISSQIEQHRVYGGVVPEIASRKHIEAISYVVDEAMESSGLSFKDLDGVAVTYGPGLVGALLVGLSYAKGLAYAIKKPLIGVHHIEGHMCSNYIENEDFTPPYLCLVVSGGHTHLVYVEDYGKYEIMGKTRDDAAGEAYDKVARALGLPYPGGPEIDRLAQKGNASAIDFPRAYLEEGSFDFSFSGLKSAVLNYLNSRKMSGEEIYPPDVAASFQKAVVDVLVQKTMLACKAKHAKKAAMAGGVSCNTFLRNEMSMACDKNGFSLQLPKPVFCTDNGVMIASCGYYNLIQGRQSALDLNAYPHLTL